MPTPTPPKYVYTRLKKSCCLATTFALVLLVSAAAAQSAKEQGPTSTPSSSLHSTMPAGEFINIVIQNELNDRVQQHRWMYSIEKWVAKQTLTEEQVETKEGPLFRVVAIDGKPLSVEQRQQEDARIDGLLHDPGQQAKVKRRQDADEQKLENIMRIMPQAFLYDYDGMVGKLVKIKFRPNPGYDAPTYETRVVANLGGTILVDPEQKRLSRLSGQVVNPVKFGFGLFGHIDSGGTMEIGRAPVGPAQWKTDFINLQLSGRMMFFKTISQQQYETRSDFRAVSGDLSLEQANQLLLAHTLRAKAR